MSGRAERIRAWIKRAAATTPPSGWLTNLDHQERETATVAALERYLAERKSTPPDRPN